MDLCLLSYIHRAQLKLNPFPHFIVENVFPTSIYSQLASSFPESIMLSTTSDIVNDRGHTTRLLRRSFGKFAEINDIWHSFAKANSGTDFFNTVVNFFLASSIDSHYPSLRKQLSHLDVVSRSGVKSHDTGKLLTDFQLVLNKKYLTNLWKQGALAGATADAAFFVNIGLGSTMSQVDILEGRMNIEIGMAVVRPAEFIILKFSHKLQES